MTQLVKNLCALWETWAWSLGLGRSPGEGKGYPLQYFGLESPTDCLVHGVAKSQTLLRNFHFHSSITLRGKLSKRKTKDSRHRRSNAGKRWREFLGLLWRELLWCGLGTWHTGRTQIGEKTPGEPSSRKCDRQTTWTSWIYWEKN